MPVRTPPAPAAPLSVSFHGSKCTVDQVLKGVSGVASDAAPAAERVRALRCARRAAE